jgi:hypothetical protein
MLSQRAARGGVDGPDQSPHGEADAAEDRRARKALPLRQVPHAQPPAGQDARAVVLPEVPGLVTRSVTATLSRPNWNKERPDMDLAAEFVASVVNAFEANKRMAERAVEQVPEEKLHVALDANTNSIAVIMKHIAGNLLSRWTDFLTTDGEKPSRNRDDEFIDTFAGRAEMLEYWERGFACLFTTLRGLKPEDLDKTVLIRGEPHSVPLAMARSLGHTCYHVGQIVQVARVQAGDTWNTLTIPRGGSEQFNKVHWGAKGKSHS